MQQLVDQERASFLRQHWHLICVIVAFLVSLIFVGLGIAQTVMGFKGYDAWVMIIWIFLNVVIFLAAILLSLPYIFHSIRTKGEEGWWAVMVIVGFVYLIGVVTTSTGGAFAFSCVNLTVFLIMLIADIAFITRGTWTKSSEEETKDTQ